MTRIRGPPVILKLYVVNIYNGGSNELSRSAVIPKAPEVTNGNPGLVGLCVQMVVRSTLGHKPGRAQILFMSTAFGFAPYLTTGSFQMEYVYLVRECGDNHEKILGAFLSLTQAIASCRLTVKEALVFINEANEKVVAMIREKVDDGYPISRLFIEKVQLNVQPVAFTLQS